MAVANEKEKEITNKKLMGIKEVLVDCSEGIKQYQNTIAENKIVELEKVLAKIEARITTCLDDGNCDS